MTSETQKSFNTTQNPPEPSELAVDLSVHVNAVLQGMVEEARNRGDLARLIGLDRASRFSDQPVNLEWVFEADEDTRSVDDDFARSYLESGVDPEQYVNFALHGGFLNEFPVEIPPELLG